MPVIQKRTSSGFQVADTQTEKLVGWVFRKSPSPNSINFTTILAQVNVRFPTAGIFKSETYLTVNVLLRGAWAGQRPGSVPVAHERDLEVNEKIVNFKFFATTSRTGPRR